MILEVCVESPRGAVAAIEGGADRVELCADLFRGGTTPSHGSLARACEHLPGRVIALIRPRGGDFCYSADEVGVCLEDIRHAVEVGVAGVAVGALTAEGRVDVASTTSFVEAAGAVPVTFHRAFDWSADPAGDLDRLMELGIARLLTSGGENTALEGREELAGLVERAGDRLEVVAAGGVRAHNALAIARATGAPALHFSAFGPPSTSAYARPERVRFSATSLPSDAELRETEAGLVREVRSALGLTR